MAEFFGMFYADVPRCLQGFYDAPYVMMGRHVLCGRNCASEGGVTALAVGWMRNAAAVRRMLRECGVVLKPDVSASSLLLYAYRQWGEACIEKIEGAVILIVIDQENGRLLLANDRMGEAGQIFYSVQGERVAFAGHPHPLLNVSGVSRKVDADGWREIFGLGPARTTGRTPFRDIRQLPCGYVLTADRQGQYLKRYFKLTTRKHEDSQRQTVERVRELIGQAVSDVVRFHPSAMLSGGLDSTALTALLSERMAAPVCTFSIDYEDNEQYFQGGSYQPEQDAPYIEKAVKAFGCKHTRWVIDAQTLANSLEEAMRARGLPGMADIDSSLLIFSKKMAGETRYVVSGECGDEVFGGYPWFRREELIERDCFPWSGSLALRESILKGELAQELRLEEYVQERWRDAMAHQVVLSGEGARESRLRRLQGVCFEYFMTNLQERASAMAQAAGLTVLTPLCDDRLIQYVYNVPWKMKGMGGVEKGLFREAMRGLLPAELLWRKKSPYPKTYHPAYTQAVRRMLTDILHNPNSPILQLIDRKAVEELMMGELSPTSTPWFGQLMTGTQMLAYLIQVNQWMEYYRIELI